MAYGYFGKLPFAGDFLRRGLAPDVIAAWDGWLQEVMLAGRSALGAERWTTAYLGAPIWRFAIAPGLLSGEGLAGIVMPSLDRVGRRFPFMIGALTDLPPLSANLTLQPVADRLEALALAMIEEGASLNGLENGLAALPAPAPVDPLWTEDAAGSLWVAAGTMCPRVQIETALPAPEAAAVWFFDPSLAETTTLET